MARSDRLGSRVHGWRPYVSGWGTSSRRTRFPHPKCSSERTKTRSARNRKHRRSRLSWTTARIEKRLRARGNRRREIRMARSASVSRKSATLPSIWRPPRGRVSLGWMAAATRGRADRFCTWRGERRDIKKRGNPAAGGSRGGETRGVPGHRLARDQGVWGSSLGVFLAEDLMEHVLERPMPPGEDRGVAAGVRSARRPPGGGGPAGKNG